MEINLFNQPYRKYLSSRMLLFFSPILPRKLLKKHRDRLETNAFILKHMKEVREQQGKVQECANDCPGALQISIKCPVSNQDKTFMNGDFHFAALLKKALSKAGYNVRIDIIPEWYGQHTLDDDATIVLRGWQRYQPAKDCINLMWVLYGSDKVEIEEINEYDHIFIASDKYASAISRLAKATVSPLLQCSDPDVFKSSQNKDDKYRHRILFVGNTRGQYRKTVKYCVRQNIPLSVYGKGWRQHIPTSLVMDTYIPNNLLYRYYSNADIVLNDHWDDMSENGFISNRIFDVALSGGFIISDSFHGEELFEGRLVTYKHEKDLSELINYWQERVEERKARSLWMQQYVLKNHTFDHRARILLQKIEEIKTVHQMRAS